MSSLFTAAEALEEITAMISYSEARILYFLFRYTYKIKKVGVGLFRKRILSQENKV